MLTCTKRQNTRLTHTQVSALGTTRSKSTPCSRNRSRNCHSTFDQVTVYPCSHAFFATYTLLARKYATDPHDAATPTVTSKSSSLSRLLFHWLGVSLRLLRSPTVFHQKSLDHAANISASASHVECSCSATLWISLSTLPRGPSSATWPRIRKSTYQVSH